MSHIKAWATGPKGQVVPLHLQPGANDGLRLSPTLQLVPALTSAWAQEIDRAYAQTRDFLAVHAELFIPDYQPLRIEDAQDPVAQSLPVPTWTLHYQDTYP